jgi:hypothetical protein
MDERESQRLIELRMCAHFLVYSNLLVSVEEEKCAHARSFALQFSEAGSKF